MARRYIRNVQLERCEEGQVGALATELTTALRELFSGSLRGEGWQVRDDDEGGLLGLRAGNGSFEGHLAVDKGTDLIQVPGQATVRKTALRVAARCANTDKKEARKQGLQTEQAVIGIGAALGALAITGLCVLLQYVVGIRVYFFGLWFPLLIAGVGAAIGGGIGAGIGRRMGDRARERSDTTTEMDELHFERVAKQWEAFIDTLAKRVDAFAQQVETDPSKPTLT
jgi:hypothetical protein